MKNKVKDLRKASGLTRYHVESAISINSRKYSRIENRIQQGNDEILIEFSETGVDYALVLTDARAQYPKNRKRRP